MSVTGEMEMRCNSKGRTCEARNKVNRRVSAQRESGCESFILGNKNQSGTYAIYDDGDLLVGSMASPRCRLRFEIYAIYDNGSSLASSVSLFPCSTYCCAQATAGRPVGSCGL